MSRQTALDKKLSTELTRDATRGLADDVNQMEDALTLHKRLLAGGGGAGAGAGAGEEAGQLKQTLRKEIGGSIWQYGGEGKVRNYTSSRDLKDKYGLKPTLKKPDPNRTRPRANSKSKDDNTAQNMEPDVSRVASRMKVKSHSTKSTSKIHRTGPGLKYNGLSENVEKKHKRVKSMEGVEGEPRLVQNFMSMHSPMNGKGQRLPPMRNGNKVRTTSEGEDMKAVGSDVDASTLINELNNDNIPDDIFDKKTKMLERMIGRINVEGKGRKSDTDGTPEMLNCDADVVRWLQSLRLNDVDKYVTIFSENDIDMETVFHMTEKQLKEVGVTGVGPVTRMMRSIREMRRAQSRQGSRSHNVQKFQPSLTKLSDKDVLKKPEPNPGLYSASMESMQYSVPEQLVKSAEALAKTGEVRNGARQPEWKPVDSHMSLMEDRDNERQGKPLLTSKSKNVAKLFTPRDELENGVPSYHTACARTKHAPSRAEDFRSSSRLQDRDGGGGKKGKSRPSSEMKSLNNGQVHVYQHHPRNHQRHGSLGTGQGLWGKADEDRAYSAMPSVRGSVLREDTEEDLDNMESSQHADIGADMDAPNTSPHGDDTHIRLKKVETEMKKMLNDLDLTDPSALERIDKLQDQLRSVQREILQRKALSIHTTLMQQQHHHHHQQQPQQQQQHSHRTKSPSPRHKISPISPKNPSAPNTDSDGSSPHGPDPDAHITPFSRPGPLPDISSMAHHPPPSRSITDRGTPGPATGKQGVASIAMSKAELLREVRRQKDEHRKQIRHLEGELHRLKHKDPMRNCEVNEDDVHFLEADLIGEGAFSQVFRGNFQGSEVAVKRLKIPLSSQDKNYFTAEVNLLRELRHPRVVLLMGVCTSCRLPLMVLEYMGRGSLYHYLHDNEKPSLDHAGFYQIARDMTLGMNYLHLHKPTVLHLDLKSMNVLLTTHMRAKIADFGFSKLRHEAESTSPGGKSVVRGTPAWMAPELLDGGNCTTKADVYSFSIILWEMLTRKHPYTGLSMFQVMEKVRKNQRPEVPENCPMGLEFLIRRCWDKNPAKRPPFKEILPTLEDLHFPPEWRSLFNTAGVPQTALDDVESTRTLINIVTTTLEKIERPAEVPALQLYDSDDDQGDGEPLSGGKLTNMDWETDSGEEDDEEGGGAYGDGGNDSDDSFRQLQQEVQEAAALYRGAVGTSRTSDGTQRSTSSRGSKEIATEQQNNNIDHSNNSENTDVINSNSNVESESPRKIPSNDEDNKGQSSNPGSAVKRRVNTGHKSERLSAKSSKRTPLNSAGSKSARLVRNSEVFDEQLRQSFPPKSDMVLRPDSGISHVTNSTVLNLDHKSIAASSHVNGSGLPLPPPPPPVPPLDMSFLITPPPPINPPPPPPSFPTESTINTRPGSGLLSEMSSVILKPVKKTEDSKQGSRQNTDFDLRASLLLEQKGRLKATEQPHPNQLTDLSAVNQDMFDNIAEVIKKAISSRRIAIAPHANSIDHSLGTSGNAWSVAEETA